MRYLLSYDVACPRRRLRVVRLLEAHGHRVQESVFLLELRPPQWQRLNAQLVNTLHAVSDHWRVWPQCQRDSLDALELGRPPPAAEGPTVVV